MKNSCISDGEWYLKYLELNKEYKELKKQKRIKEVNFKMYEELLNRYQQMLIEYSRVCEVHNNLWKTNIKLENELNKLKKRSI